MTTPAGAALYHFSLRLVLVAVMAAASLAVPVPVASAQVPPSTTVSADTKWVDAWGASYLPTLVNGALQNVPTFNNQTLRQNVFCKLSGNSVRVKIANRFSTAPLVIGSAHIATRATPASSAIVADSDAVLTFNGAKTLTLEAGKEIWSDPAKLVVKQHEDVAISLFLPESIKPTAFHATGLKTGFLSAIGDHAGDASFAGPRTTTSYFFVSGLQVMAPAKTHVIVALGDSITDGATSANDGNASWPDVLSKRLPSLKDGTPVSVVNMGIGSNRVVSADAAGPTGLKRMDEDVLSRPNVTHLIVMEGINDISYEQATPEKLIGAYKEIIEKAHGKGIKVFGATLLPIQNSRKDTPENEATRQAVNKWIRESKAYDAVLDFEKVVQDPANPLRIRQNLTTDYVHPNTAGYKLMADSIDLKLFE